jgi:putative peptidoglycan lipid II flippase
MSENARVTKAAGVVGAATLLSRIFGFIRDVVIAWFFGAGLASDAFFVAFRIPNLLRRLFAEGSLTIAFVPVFTEYLTDHGKAEAFSLARSAVRLLSVILIVTVIAGILFAPAIIRVLAPGFGGSTEKLAMTLTLTRIMFPYIFFISLVALCMGILNALGHFAAPALAPVFLNIGMISAVLVVSPYFADPVMGLAVGVIIGGILQLALQVPFLIKKGLYFWEKARLSHPGLRRIGKLMLPAIFGAAVYQINSLVGIFLASFLAEGSISYLYYADRLVQFPLGIFAIATATAVLPSLSRQFVSRDFEGAKATFAYALKLVFFITVPAMVGLIVLKEPIVALLFKRGAFDAETTLLTADALLFYALGLWAFSAVRIVLSAFYALQDTKTPVRIAVVAILANIALGVILMQWLAHGGLALALSLSSMLNFWLLLQALRRRLGPLGWGEIWVSIAKTLICSMIMGVVVWGMARMVIPSADGAISVLFLGLFGCIIIGIASYGLFSILMKSTEVQTVWTIVRERVKK